VTRLTPTKAGSNHGRSVGTPLRLTTATTASVCAWSMSAVMRATLYDAATKWTTFPQHRISPSQATSRCSKAGWVSTTPWQGRCFRFDSRCATSATWMLVKSSCGSAGQAMCHRPSPPKASCRNWNRVKRCEPTSTGGPRRPAPMRSPWPSTPINSTTTLTPPTTRTRSRSPSRSVRSNRCSAFCPGLREPTQAFHSPVPRSTSCCGWTTSVSRRRATSTSVLSAGSRASAGTASMTKP